MSGLDESRRKVTQGAAAAQATDLSSLPPLDWLAMYGLKVKAVVKIGRIGGVFDLALDDGRCVQMGTTEELLTPRLAQARIADAIDITLPELKRADWRSIAMELIRIAEVKDIGSGAQEELKEWINSFTGAQAPDPYQPAQKAEIVDALDVGGAALDSDGVVYLSLPRLQAALLALSPTRITRADLMQRLYRDGFRPTILDVKPNGRATSAEDRKSSRVWISPNAYVALLRGKEGGSNGSSSAEGGVKKNQKEALEPLERNASPDLEKS